MFNSIYLIFVIYEKNYLFLQKRKITKNKLKCAFQLTTIETGKYYLTNKSNT